MNNTDSQAIQELLEDVKTSNEAHYKIMLELRGIVFDQYPKATERVMYGGIMFTLDKDFGGIFSSKKHVSFEFSEGYKLNDPDGNLEGSGRERRHLKIVGLADVAGKDVRGYVGQVGKLID